MAPSTGHTPLRRGGRAREGGSVRRYYHRTAIGVIVRYHVGNHSLKLPREAKALGYLLKYNIKYNIIFSKRNLPESQLRLAGRDILGLLIGQRVLPRLHRKFGIN